MKRLFNAIEEIKQDYIGKYLRSLQYRAEQKKGLEEIKSTLANPKGHLENYVAHLKRKQDKRGGIEQRINILSERLATMDDIRRQNDKVIDGTTSINLASRFFGSSEIFVYDKMPFEEVSWEYSEGEKEVLLENRGEKEGTSPYYKARYKLPPNIKRAVGVGICSAIPLLATPFTGATIAVGAAMGVDKLSKLFIQEDKCSAKVTVIVRRKHKEAEERACLAREIERLNTLSKGLIKGDSRISNSDR